MNKAWAWVKRIPYKWLFLIVGLAAGIVLSVGTSESVQALSSNGFCSSCHDSSKFQANFAKAAHAEVPCITCHTQGVVKDKTQGVGHMITTLTGSKDPNNYHEIKAKNVSNDKCLSCHNLDNEKRDPYRVDRHQGYLRKDFECTRCHDGTLMHGKLTDN